MEDVETETFQKNVMTAMYKSNFQKDKDAKAYMRNVVMPGAKMTLTTQHSCVTVKTGPKEDTKRVAITSERGERGGITKCATHVAGNFVAVANQQLPRPARPNSCSIGQELLHCTAHTLVFKL